MIAEEIITGTLLQILPEICLLDWHAILQLNLDLEIKMTVDLSLQNPVEQILEIVHMQSLVLM